MIRNQMLRYAKRSSLAVAVLVAVLSTTLPARAQGITGKQADELLQQNRDVLNELKQIHQLLERQQAAPARPTAPTPSPENNIHVELTPGAYSMGRVDAPLTLIEFTDYQCPFCRRFHTVTFEEIKKNYIDTGKLRYVTQDFPLDMHENAPRAAMAARCAGDQGKFWELRHVMIVNANQLQPQNITTYATELKLDADKLNACIASGKYRAEIDRNLAEGRAAGVSGTPSFVLGRSTGKSALDGVRIVGAQAYSAFDSKIKELLEKVPPS